VNKLALILFAAIVIGAGCNNDTNKTATDPLSKDSIARVNNVAAYKKGLVDLSNNTDIATLVSQGWEMEDDMDALNSSDAEGMMPFRSFYLAPDNSFVRNIRGYMEYGHWSFDNPAKTITLKYEGKDGGKDVYKIAAIAPKELIVINTGINSITKLKFIASGTHYSDITADPYHISNNQWRIAPNKAETDEAIRKRLKDCLHFYILFYKDNIAKEEKKISFYGFPTCLKWYAGGIFIVKQDQLASNWYKCFYNKDQAIKAYKMMDAIIGKKYTWPKEKVSWVQKNLSVLEQMYGQL
jgi:hypothetical protein